ncbi:Putative Fis-like DNA-binding protein (modular protein) [Burkholderiales bacterium]|nr:Putative Fis-like DNA-binding protein (modular protein) [Burkholderiales bacterium]
MNRMAERKQVAALTKTQTGGAVSGRNGTVAQTAGATRKAALQNGESLEQSVFRSLDQYFSNLHGAKPHALHEMVLGAIEKPLLQFALQRCDGNQSAAADLLGINRNTLRRKLQEYGLH